MRCRVHFNFIGFKQNIDTLSKHRRLRALHLKHLMICMLSFIPDFVHVVVHSNSTLELLFVDLDLLVSYGIISFFILNAF